MPTHTDTHCSLKPNRPQVSHKCFQTAQATVSLEKSHVSFQFKQSEVPKQRANQIPVISLVTLIQKKKKKKFFDFFPLLVCGRTSSFMPVSRSIMTQASMGRAISRLLLFRCSSRAVPNAGFSVQESGRERLTVESISAFCL